MSAAPMPKPNAVPAVCVPGAVGIVKTFAAPLATVKETEPAMVGLLTKVAVSVVLPDPKRVIAAVPTPLVLNVTAEPLVQLAPAVGYTGALPLGALAGPLKAMHLVPLKPVPPLPYASPAVMVSVNCVPAVGVGVDNVNPVKGPPLTVKVVEALMPFDVTLSVAVWASKSVIGAVAVPLVKVTEAG